MSIVLSAAADLLLKEGGAWIGALRKAVQWRGGNGDRVTWGSGDIIAPALSIGDLEKLAAEAVAAQVAHLSQDDVSQVRELISLRDQRDRLIKSLPPQAQVAKREKLEEETANLHTLGFSGHLMCRPQDCEVVRRLKEILADNERLSAQNADLHSGVCAGYAKLKANADRILSGKTQTELLGRIRDARDKLSEALTLAASLTETEAPKAPAGEA